MRHFQNLPAHYRYGILLIAGALCALAQAPYFLIFFCFLAFPLLVWQLDVQHSTAFSLWQRLKIRFFSGWLFGLGYFIAGLWWLGNAVTAQDASLIWAVPFAIIGLPAYLALFYGLACAVSELFWRPGLSRIICLAVFFAIAEWLRAHLFTGFPWNAIGYTLMPHPLFMQSSALLGLYVINAFAVIIFCAPIFFWEKHTRKTALFIVMVLVGAHTVFGYYRLSQAPSIETYQNDPSAPIVRLVQPSIPQSQKWDNETRSENFRLLLNLTTAQKADDTTSTRPDYIVWPETSIPYLLDAMPQLRSIIAETLQGDQYLLVGRIRSTLQNDQYFYYNALDVIDAQGQSLAHTDKRHLVPFGEYMPFQELFTRIGFSGLASMAGQYQAGGPLHSITLPNHISFLALICYEAIFPHELHYQGDKPQFMVNISNDAWYGDSSGPWQHFHQARLRSVETGLPLVRSANNGVSAIIDGYGRIVTILPRNEVTYRDGRLPPPIPSLHQGATSPLFCWMVFVLLFIFSIILGKNKYILQN